MEAESNANKILKQADIAMYDAKHQGRNTICLFH
jgi:GGDEF domain-containing protein